MNNIEPDVFLLAVPAIRYKALDRYLRSVNASEWRSDASTDAEKLPEIAGRLCYRSWKPGLNANVTKVREGNVPYIQNILKQGHGSVLEHSQVSWIFSNVSRVFTHELVRHRVGVGISQESLRYVRLTELGVWLPDCISQNPEMTAECVNIVEQLEAFQVKAAEHYGLDDPEMKFSRKKEVTSALRRLAPIGLATTIMWSCNFRTLRHVIEMRTSKHAEEEIRKVFCKVAKLCLDIWPAVFGDYEENADGEWVTLNRKV